MGTRGFVGFVSEGRETLVYNQYDSYPSGLGVDTLEFCRKHTQADDWKFIKEEVDILVHIDSNVPPTADQIAKLEKYADLNVSERTLSDWYCLLRKTQGELDLILESGHVESDVNFALDSLYCEWGYLINLDENLFEVYEGYQRQPHTQGRFSQRNNLGLGYTRTDGDYYPVRLVAQYPLSDLPSAADFTDYFAEKE